MLDQTASFLFFFSFSVLTSVGYRELLPLFNFYFLFELIEMERTTEHMRNSLALFDRSFTYLEIFFVDRLFGLKTTFFFFLN